MKNLGRPSQPVVPADHEPIFHPRIGFRVRSMLKVRHLAALAVATLAGCALAGCGTINEKLAAGVSDVIPAWAGGLPADAPPRPGTAKYDEYMRERDRKRLTPAAEREEEAKPAGPAGLDAIH